jgi:hypothetical protein
MSKPQTAKGPDNNRRLAALEAGVSALAIALVANGVTLDEGADPFEAAIGRVKHAGLLEDRLGAATAELENAKAALAEIAGNSSDADREAAEGDIELDRLRARNAELETEIAELMTDVEEAMSEKNRLANELAAVIEGRPQADPNVSDQGDEAPAAPVVRERPEVARDVGPNAGVFSSAELDELLTTGAVHGLELAFSNGDYEVVSLQPVPIAPNDLQPAEGRHMVVPPIYAKLLATDPQEELAGVGLLLAGAQIAYCSFHDRLTLQPGSERRFERTIFF